MGLSQQRLAAKSGVSLGSIKRFERVGEISLTSLIKVAFALECEDDLTHLFAQNYYTSIQEIIDAQR
ncbi:MAG: helix-turn-helix domain-containing protein [Coriobacteriia bacterium]|nr:helix-turn-helix domain-containing protein [Coriobacteriia bacterium]